MTRTVSYRITATSAKGDDGDGNGDVGGNGLIVTYTITTTSNSITYKFQKLSGGGGGDGAATDGDGGKGGDGVYVAITDDSNSLNISPIIYAGGGGGGGSQETDVDDYGYGGKAKYGEYLPIVGNNEVAVWKAFKGANGIGNSWDTRGGRSGGNGGRGEDGGGHGGDGSDSTGGSGGTGKNYGGGGGGGGYEGGGGGGGRNSYAAGGGAGSSRIRTNPTSISNSNTIEYKDNVSQTYASVKIEIKLVDNFNDVPSVTSTASTTAKTSVVDFWDNPTLVDYSTQTTGNLKFMYFTDLPGSDVLYSNATFTYNVDKDTETPDRGPGQSYFGMNFSDNGYILFSKDDYDNKLTKYTINYQATSDINKKSDWKLLTVYTGVSNCKLNGTDFSEIYKRADNTNDDTVSNYLYEGKPLSNYFKVKTSFTNGGNSGYKTTINGNVYDFDDVFERI